MAYEKEMDCRSNMSLSEMVLQYCFWRRGIHKVLSIKPGVWVYDVLMLGEIGFVLLNTRWMYPGRTNHLFCGVHVPSSVPCQLCRLSDQSSLRGAGSPCNFILPTINANMLPQRLRTKCFNRETVREISKNVILPRVVERIGPARRFWAVYLQPVRLLRLLYRSYLLLVWE